MRQTPSAVPQAPMAGPRTPATGPTTHLAGLQTPPAAPRPLQPQKDQCKRAEFLLCDHAAFGNGVTVIKAVTGPKLLFKVKKEVHQYISFDSISFCFIR